MLLKKLLRWWHAAAYYAEVWRACFTVGFAFAKNHALPRMSALGKPETACSHNRNCFDSSYLGPWLKESTATTLWYYLFDSYAHEPKKCACKKMKNVDDCSQGLFCHACWNIESGQHNWQNRIVLNALGKKKKKCCNTTKHQTSSWTYKSQAWTIILNNIACLLLMFF